jgi:dipeptidyl aminopeptidase/acylaminoacyl peptidase
MRISRSYHYCCAVILTLGLLAGCAGAPSLPATTAPQATTQAAAAPTAQPTDAPAPTALAPTSLPPTPAPTAAPSSSPAPQADTSAPASAGYLVYQRADGSLWRSDGSGQPPINLADPTEPSALLPWAASPDGKTIAIVAGTGLWYQFHENPTLALWLVAADGSNRRKIQDLPPPRGVDLTPGGDDAFNLVPALTTQQKLSWSPDGQLVAFVSAHQDQVDLYSAAIDGTVTRLTDTPRLEQGPRWSPDGALIAYRTTSSFGTGAGWGEVALEATPRTGGPPALVMNDRVLAAGSEAVAIPDLLWISPNVIVAGMADSIVGNAEVRALMVGGAPTLVFDAPYSALAWNEATAQLAIAGTSESIAHAKIDARKLAPGLFSWSPDTGPPVQIESAPAVALAWTPQGDALAYSIGGEQPGLRLWAIGAEGDVKPLAATPAQSLHWSLDGQQLATDMAIYSRAGQPLIEQPAQMLPIGWGPQGLFYSTAAAGNDQALWLWEGAQARQIESKLTNAQTPGVVLVRS